MLTVTKTGTGASEGTVTSEDNKITCGATCNDRYEQNSSVVLNAKGNDKSEFKGWTQCTNSLEPQITVTVEAAKTCEATFDLKTIPPVVTPTEKQPQTITILSLTGEVGKNTTLKVTGGGSQNPVKLVDQTADICTVADSNINFIQAGECKIEATQSGNEQYYDAQPVIVTITVTPAKTQPTDPSSSTKKDQTIIAFSLSSVVSNGALTAKGGNSNNPIVFASKSEDVCTVNNSAVNFAKAGTCTLTADQAGNDQYNPAPQLTVTLGVQTATTPVYTSCAVLADAPIVNDTCDDITH